MMTVSQKSRDLFSMKFSDDIHVISVEDVPDHLTCFIHESVGMVFFHHPNWVTTLPTMSPVPFLQALEDRVARTNKAILRGDWEGYVFGFERAYRMEKLLLLPEFYPGETQEKRGAVRFWQLAAEVWVDAEHDETDQIWTDLMDCGVPWRAAMTTGPERRALRHLLDDRLRLTVWRGVQAATPEAALGHALGGWSWSASRDVAAWFSHRWLTGTEAAKPYVARATVYLDDVAGYLTGRGEREVLIDPREVAHGDTLEGLAIEPAGPRPKSSSCTEETDQ